MTNKLRTIARRVPKGFTLIETLFAVLILVTAITGPLTIAAKGLQLALIAKDQTTASYLAQDAMEYVRDIRDTNRLSGFLWLAALNGTADGNLAHPDAISSGTGVDCVSADASASCLIDSIQSTITSCQGASCATFPLYYDSVNNYFTYTQNANTTKTIFVRTVSIKTPSSGGNANEAEVTVTVRWSDIGGVSRFVTLRENMLNWQ